MADARQDAEDAGDAKLICREAVYRSIVRQAFRFSHYFTDSDYF